MNHYTYKITVDAPTDSREYYIGVRSSFCMPEEDIKYLGSSRHLRAWIHENGVSSIRKEILAVFKTRVEAVSHEVHLHEKFCVATNVAFFNRANQKTTGFDTTGCLGPRNGIQHTDSAKQKNRMAHIGLPAWNKGMKMSKEFGEEVSKRMKGRVGVNAGKTFSDEWCAKLTASRTGVLSHTFLPWCLIDANGKEQKYIDVTMKDHSLSLGLKLDAMRTLLRCTQKHGVVKRGAFKGYKVFKLTDKQAAIDAAVDVEAIKGAMP
jgi:hypothetical protein